MCRSYVDGVATKALIAMKALVATSDEGFDSHKLIRGGMPQML